LLLCFIMTLRVILHVLGLRGTFKGKHSFSTFVVGSIGIGFYLYSNFVYSGFCLKSLFRKFLLTSVPGTL
jgi:hypothetical protein